MNKKFGPYDLIKELGRGGMGVVYEGWDESLNRRIAIKVLSDQLADNAEVVERFKREAKSMAALNHPNIIQIYSISDHEGQPYFVMEFVEGESLADRLKRDGKLTVQDAKKVLEGTALGLSVAHDRGVIHRDIKPGNLMLTTQGTVKIADFGIAMTQDFGERLTSTGEFVGTPGYLSPEVCTGQTVDQRTDIFALGIVFYEMLTGDLPFTDASPLGMMLEVVKAEIPDVRAVNSEVDDLTYRLLCKMIAKDVDERYQSCRDLLGDLDYQGKITHQSGTVAMPISEAGATVVSAPSLEQQGPRSARDMTVVEGQEQQSRGKGLLFGMAAAILALFIAGGWFGYQEWQKTQNPSPDRLAVVKSVEENNGSEAQAGISDEQLEAARKEASSDDSGSDADPISEDLSRQTQAIADQAESDSNDDSISLNPMIDQPSDETLLAKVDQEQSGALTPPVSTEGVEEAADNTVADIQQRFEAKVSDVENRIADQGVVRNTAEPIQVAKLTPPPDPAPMIQPSPPRIVVLAIGDPAVVATAQQSLSAALLNEDHELIEADLIPGLADLLDAPRVDIPAVTDLMLDNGADVLVLAQADYLGQEQIFYYGETSTLYSVNLNVRNYLLAEKRRVGKGWQQKVSFTQLNAEEKTREALQPMLAGVTSVMGRLRDEKMK